MIHWIGAAQKKASVIRDNFENAASPGSTQYIADWETGEIIEAIPEAEVAYHVGAAESKYTALKREICGDGNPNDYLIGVECCIGDGSIDGWETSTGIGKPSDAQYEALVELSADIMKRCGLDPQDRLLRHYDITGKRCHVWFTANPGEWEKFRLDVKRKMEEEDVTVYKGMGDIPEWGKPVVLKLTESGSLRGNEKGELNISEDMLRILVILEREGVI